MASATPAQMVLSCSGTPDAAAAQTDRARARQGSLVGWRSARLKVTLPKFDLAPSFRWSRSYHLDPAEGDGRGSGRPAAADRQKARKTGDEDLDAGETRREDGPRRVNRRNLPPPGIRPGWSCQRRRPRGQRTETNGPKVAANKRLSHVSLSDGRIARARAGPRASGSGARSSENNLGFGVQRRNSGIFGRPAA